MLAGYASRGLKAGVVAGAAFGLFVALVGAPLVELSEAVVAGHDHVHGEHAPLLGTATSVVAGVLWGLLAGGCFGVVYYFAEPALPGGTDAGSYLLGVAGFVTVAGAPWLVLPPRPAGLEAPFATDVRLFWFAAMMVAGATACVLALVAYRRVRSRGRRIALVAAAVPFALPVVLAAVAPNATVAAGAADPALVAAYRGVVALGQVALWGTLATTHAHLRRRATAVDRDGFAATAGAD